MAEDAHEFEVELTFGRAIPEWGWRQEGYRARASRAAIEKAGGPIPAGESLAEAFAPCKETLNKAAMDKIAAARGEVGEEPVELTADDVTP